MINGSQHAVYLHLERLVDTEVLEKSRSWHDYWNAVPFSCSVRRARAQKSQSHYLHFSWVSELSNVSVGESEPALTAMRQLAFLFVGVRQRGVPLLAKTFDSCIDGLAIHIQQFLVAHFRLQ